MKLKILYVNLDFSYPLKSGGNVALFYRISELSKKGHQIYLFLATRANVGETSINELKKYCKNVKVYKVGKLELILNLLVFPLMPIRTIRRFSRRMHKDIRDFLSSTKIDVFLVEPSNMAVYFREEYSDTVKSYKSVIVFQELVYKSLLREARYLPFSLKKLIFYIESFKTKRFEYNVFKSNMFDEFWFYSTDDIHDVKKFPKLKDKIRFIPVGVELKKDSEIRAKEVPGVAQNDKMILIIGSMDNPSNEDAVRWFAKKIFPEIKCRVLNAKFCIIGKNSKHKLRDIVSKDIIIIGEVPDIKPYLNRCDLYAVPQRGGAGVRVKLLDGLSAKKIVITTPIGVEAIKDIKPDIHFLLARNEEEFANKTVEVLEKPEKFEEIAENGFNFFKQLFSVEAAGNIVEEYLLNLCYPDYTSSSGKIR